MRSAKVVLGGVVLALICLLAVGGVGHNDEVSYVVETDGSGDQAVSVNIQNTGSFRRYLKIVGLRRYGPPFELFLSAGAPAGSESVELRDLEVVDGDRTVLAVAEAELPIETFTVFEASRRATEEIATYTHPEILELEGHEVTVRGSLRWQSAGGVEERTFARRFRRVREAGFFTGL